MKHVKENLLFVLTVVLATTWATTTTGMAQTAIPRLAAGSQHSLALMPNGTVKSWGKNTYGQLGLGNFGISAYQTSPQQIPSGTLSSVVAIAAGYDSSYALHSNGTVHAWGWNDAGQLGLGNTTDQTTPQQIPAGSLNNATAIAAGMRYGLALLVDGTVKAWGHNAWGQLGLGNNTDQTTPQQIPASSLSNVVAIAAGSGHSLALLANGTVMAWGDNTYGELGLGNNTSFTTPQLVPTGSLSGAVAVAVGYLSSFALLANGTVMAWGGNNYGQLGLGNTTTQLIPQQIPAPTLSNVTAIVTGSAHVLALLADGTIKVWGYNNAAQLGLPPSSSMHTSPQQIPATAVNNGRSLATGGAHSFVLLSNGTAKGFGGNPYGELGLGYAGGLAPSVIVTTPTLLPGLCLSGGAAYQLQFGPLGNAAMGITIPCNPVTGGFGGQHYYFNTFSADALNANSPGSGAWHGLHISPAELLAWADLGLSGLAVAMGPLAASGGATAMMALAPATLSGVTVYGVSVAFSPVTLAVANYSPITSHTF